MELLYSPATAADLPHIWDIEKTLIGAWTFKQLQDELAFAPGWSFVARSQGITLGYIFGIKAADEGEIRKIAISPNYRRKGLAAELLKTALQHLAHHNIISCFLEVRQNNKAALGLYQKYRFKEVGIRKKYYTLPQDNAIILRRDL